MLLDAAGEPKVSDFGLAKWGHANLTRTQAVGLVLVVAVIASLWLDAEGIGRRTLDRWSSLLARCEHQ